MLAGLHTRFASRFVRSEPRARALAYLRGLIAPLEQKNGWTPAERAGDRLPIGMQRLLGEADWDADGVRDDVRDYVVETIGDKDAVLIGDDTGFLKKGVRSAGVQRQYSGTAGRTESCQAGTFLVYASAKGRALVERELYVPVSWADDRARCRDAGIPDEVPVAAKTGRFKAMLHRAVEAKVPFAWVTADEVYGQSESLRRWMEQRVISHVMCVKTSDTVITRGMGECRVDEPVAGLAPQAWKRLSAGQGSHGERRYQWARVPVRIWWENGSGHWVLARRSLKDATESAYYVCYGPVGTRLKDLVRVAGAR